MTQPSPYPPLWIPTINGDDIPATAPTRGKTPPQRYESKADALYQAQQRAKPGQIAGVRPVSTWEHEL